MRHRWLGPLTALTLLAAPAAPALAAGPAPAAGPPDAVVIQPGDTLWGLAHRNGTTVADLQRLNNLGDSTLIRIGQRLIIRDDAAARRARRTAAAIAYAEAQLGKPYVFATAGPDSFDCSGLVMRAWGSAGVQLPRVTYQQITVGEKVTRDQLVPGDLVFTNNGGHVELYVGDDEVINAGHTGVQVHREALPREEKVVAYVHLTDV